MTKMYVANCTHQVQDFAYRLPENPKVLRQKIDVGQQVLLSGDLSAPDITAVIEQHAPYGLVDASEVDRTKVFVGLCYSLEKPVSLTRVRSALEHNGVVLDARGREIRKEAGVAVHESILGQNRNLKALHMDVVEDEKEGRDIQVDEHLTVDRRANGSGGGGSRGGGRRRAA